MLALITAILGAPAAINALLARVSALEAALSDMRKQSALAAVDAAQKVTEQAQTIDDLRKAAEANAEALRKLGH